MDDLSGQTIGGFRVGEAIGEGGFARVYAAAGPGGERAIVKVGLGRGGSRGRTRGIAHPALAVVLGSVTTELRSVGPAEVDATLRAEARLLRQARGRLLPRLLAEEQVGGRPALVLERLTDATLRDALAAGRPPAPRWWHALLVELARAAGEGALPFHGDLKPEHVFLASSGPRLIDPAFRADDPTLYTLTPEYNPLLAHGPLADVTAVVSMMLEADRGAPPFPGAPPSFALRLIPSAREEERLRRAFRAQAPVATREGPLAAFLEEALDELLLRPGGDGLGDPGEAAARLARHLPPAGHATPPAPS